MALIKKFRIKSYKEDETIVEIKNASVFYNKRQILNNLNLFSLIPPKARNFFENFLVNRLNFKVPR